MPTTVGRLIAEMESRKDAYLEEMAGLRAKLRAAREDILMGIAGQSADEIRELYWDSTISTREIAEAYGIPRERDVSVIAGPHVVEFRCLGCAGPHSISYNSRYDRSTKGRPGLCKPCDQARVAEWVQKVTCKPEEEEPATTDFARMPYKEYLLTPEWQQRRNAALKRAGYRCQVCNGEGQLDVHHRTYERRGREQPPDLTVLCRTCHSTFHCERRAERRDA